MNPKVSAIYKESVFELTSIYGEAEAQSIVNILLEDLLNISRIQRLTNVDLELNNEAFSVWKNALERLKQQEPVQHIVGRALFHGHSFRVSKDTLIPRPETEELVDLIIAENKNQKELRILDVGTGTGCIAIALNLALKNAIITGWDISEEALEIARQNADTLGSNVLFEKHDILVEIPAETLDIIVSNPPYIPNADKATMLNNVLNYEPLLALFVPDTDPLCFYRRIATAGLQVLSAKGRLYFEIHENFGGETTEMLKEMGYNEVRVLQDLNGKDRMIRAIKPN